jgi:hypothetical protein
VADHYNLVVIGRHPVSSLGRRLAASTATSVLEQSHTTIAVVPEAAVVDDAIVLRTEPYSTLGTYAPGSLVAFEVDWIDYERHLGWSVLARGRAHAITDPGEVKALFDRWPPRPWADGARSLFLRLPWDELSGVRLGRGWTARNESPVSRRV